MPSKHWGWNFASSLARGSEAPNGSDTWTSHRPFRGLKAALSLFASRHRINNANCSSFCTNFAISQVTYQNIAWSLARDFSKRFAPCSSCKMTRMGDLTFKNVSRKMTTVKAASKSAVEGLQEASWQFRRFRSTKMLDAWHSGTNCVSARMPSTYKAGLSNRTPGAEHKDYQEQRCAVQHDVLRQLYLPLHWSKNVARGDDGTVEDVIVPRSAKLSFQRDPDGHRWRPELRHEFVLGWPCP